MPVFEVTVTSFGYVVAKDLEGVSTVRRGALRQRRLPNRHQGDHAPRRPGLGP
jgi:hypothetical protein